MNDTTDKSVNISMTYFTANCKDWNAVCGTFTVEDIIITIVRMPQENQN